MNLSFNRLLSIDVGSATIVHADGFKCFVFESDLRHYLTVMCLCVCMYACMYEMSDVRWEMYIRYKTLAILLSTYQQLLKLMDI